MLSQSEVGKLLDQCAQLDDSLLAIEEILSAYIAWKLIRGQSCEVVLQKMRYLAIFLRVTDRRWVLESGKDVFRVLALELTYGGSLIGASPAKTQTGKQVWNDLRRKLSNMSYSFSTDPEYGGPITFHRPRYVDTPQDSVNQPEILSTSASPTRRSRRTDQATSSDDDPRVTTFSTGLALASGHDTHEASTSAVPEERHDSILSFFRRPHRAFHVFQSSSERLRWSERPRWARIWFLTRPHLAGTSRMLEMLTPEYVSLVPAYTSFRGTLPLYLSLGERSRGSRQ